MGTTPTRIASRSKRTIKRHPCVHSLVAATATNVFIPSFFSQVFFSIPFSSLHCHITEPVIILINLYTQMEEREEVSRGRKVEEMEGVASIALLPCGSISGHFIQLPHSICYGLHGSELPCERECSRGEDYRLIKLTITDFNMKKEQVTVVECKGHDAARFNSIDHAHGWEKDVTGMVEQNDGKKRIMISFECQTLKAEKAAEDHIRQFMPKLVGMDAVVNIGRMTISGLDFGAEEEETD